MITINIQEAQRNLPQLLERVISGEEIIITSDDYEIAVISPTTRPFKCRVPGSAKGRISISSDFDAPLTEFI